MSDAIPLTLQDLCQPSRAALLVYDMQTGIFNQAPQLRTVTPQISAMLQAARQTAMPVFFSRHMSLPKKLTGESQMRTAMIWQHAGTPQQVRERFVRNSPELQLIPELEPRTDEAVFEKLSMSFFAGTPLDMSLRDLGVRTVLITGVVLEIGILPTVLQAIDQGYVPVVITDACGSVDNTAREHVLAYLRYIETAVLTDTAKVTALLTAQS